MVSGEGLECCFVDAFEGEDCPFCDGGGEGDGLFVVEG